MHDEDMVAFEAAHDASVCSPRSAEVPTAGFAENGSPIPSLSAESAFPFVVHPDSGGAFNNLHADMAHHAFVSRRKTEEHMQRLRRRAADPELRRRYLDELAEMTRRHFEAKCKTEQSSPGGSSSNGSANVATADNSKRVKVKLEMDQPSMFVQNYPTTLFSNNVPPETSSSYDPVSTHCPTQQPADDQSMLPQAPLNRVKHEMDQPNMFVKNYPTVDMSSDVLAETSLPFDAVSARRLVAVANDDGQTTSMLPQASLNKTLGQGQSNLDLSAFAKELNMPQHVLADIFEKWPGQFDDAVCTKFFQDFELSNQNNATSVVSGPMASCSDMTQVRQGRWPGAFQRSSAQQQHVPLKKDPIDWPFSFEMPQCSQRPMNSAMMPCAKQNPMSYEMSSPPNICWSPQVLGHNVSYPTGSQAVLSDAHIAAPRQPQGQHYYGPHGQTGSIGAAGMHCPPPPSHLHQSYITNSFMNHNGHYF